MNNDLSPQAVHNSLQNILKRLNEIELKIQPKDPPDSLERLEQAMGFGKSVEPERKCHACHKEIIGKDWLWTGDGSYWHPGCFPNWISPVDRKLRDSQSCVAHLQGELVSAEKRIAELEGPASVMKQLYGRWLGAGGDGTYQNFVDLMEREKAYEEVKKQITARDHTIERCGKRTAELESQIAELKSKVTYLGELRPIRMLPSEMDKPCKEALAELRKSYAELERQTRNFELQVERYEVAMRQEKQTAWHEEVKSLADELRAASEYPDTCPKQIIAHRLRSAGILLNDLWQCYTHKANMVPRDLRINELEGKLSAIGMARDSWSWDEVDRILKRP